MAEIYYCEDESGETQYEGGGDPDTDISEGNEVFYQDEHLSPIAKLEKYAVSDAFNRQYVVRTIQDTLRTVIDTPDISKVLEIMTDLSRDFEPNVRHELMEQVPHIAMFCQECPQQLSYIVPQHILPMVVRFLTDDNNQVRKTSQAALLVLLEQELVDKVDVEKQVCPLILKLTLHENIDDIRIEAVALMSKMAPLIGKYMTERLFLNQFALLCLDSVFHIRKVCAANFGDMCTVIGKESTENILLSKFYTLCEDGIWGVRKACVDCFMTVSCTCSLEVRKNELAPLFVSLLCDCSRWVRVAAFQSLGPFISTFADSSVTGLYFDDEGVLTYHNPEEKLQNLKVPEDLKNINSTDNLGKEFVIKKNCTDDIKEIQNIQLVNGSFQEVSSFKSLGERVDSMVLEEYDDDSKTVITTSISHKFESSLVFFDDLSWEEKRAEKYGEWNHSENKYSLSSLKSPTNMKGKSSSSKNLSESVTSSHEKIKENSDKSNTLIDNSMEDFFSFVDNDAAFNSFHFWRFPVPEIDIDLDIIGNKCAQNIPHLNSNHLSPDVNWAAENGVTLDNKVDSLSDNVGKTKLEMLHIWFDYEEKPEYLTQIRTANINIVSDSSEIAANLGTTHVISSHANEATVAITEDPHTDSSPQLNQSAAVQSVEESSSVEQSVIPPVLLEQYIGMTDPSKVQALDVELPQHCAFSLAAVAYTLGRKHWNCLKHTYEKLATDMQWKIRKAIAFSIHELAVILGEDITSRDLVPVFNEFFKDLDEVRIGVLKHLADFISILKPSLRQQYLSRFAEFLKTDNDRNWRFRMELAEQLIQLCDLYSTNDIRFYIVPIAKTLAMDKVSEVRHLAYRVICVILKIFCIHEDNKSFLSLQKELVQTFAYVSYWKCRQTYCHMCHYFFDGKAISHELFAEHFLPSLLTLSKDPVPNIRIAVSRTLSSLIALEYFSSNRNPYHEQLLSALVTLHNDPDRDVRFYANSASHLMHHKDMVSV